MVSDWTNSSNAKLNTDVMISKADLTNRCSYVIIGLYVLAVILYSSVCLEVFYESENDEIDSIQRELLIKMEFPFAIYKSPIYECVLFAQFMQLMCTASGIAMLDALIITMILHVGGQIEMMHQMLEKISVEEAKHGLSRSTIKQLYNRHQNIIIFTENIENLFSYIALMQLLCNTLSICCIGFLLVVTFNTDRNVKSIIRILFFYIVITLEAFIFCFAGEYLSNKSMSVNNAAYDSLWYILKPNDSRVILLIMVRSQKKLTISAGKFTELSLQGFASMLKASASYVSVLFAMY
ncbi:odorant receptor 22c-like [Colletes latitarsis]|uniref:odorant receptor 22c-like n=1 Tax=Colletes latitarsis TaxID=2605962 RepID=UPI0040369B2D